MSGVQGTKSAAEPDINHGIGGGSHSNGGGGGGGGGLVGIATVQQAFTTHPPYATSQPPYIRAITSTHIHPPAPPSTVTATRHERDKRHHRAQHGH